MVRQINPIGYDIQRTKDQIPLGTQEERPIFKIFNERLSVKIGDTEFTDGFDSSVIDTTFWTASGTSLAESKCSITNGYIGTATSFSDRTVTFTNLSFATGVSPNSYWGFRGDADNYIRFYASGTALYGQTNKAGTASSFAITGITLSDENDYKIIWRDITSSQDVAAFYINDSKKGEITSVPQTVQNVYVSVASGETVSIDQVDVDFKPILAKRNISGTTMVWGSSVFGIWNGAYWGTGAIPGFVLSHTTAGVLGSNVLGDSVMSTWQVAKEASSSIYTLNGKNLIRDQIGYASGSYPSHLGIGTGAQTLTEAVTGLSSALATRYAKTSSICDHPKEVHLRYEMSSVATSGVDITEAGGFTAATSGYMHYAFNHDTVQKSYYEDWTYHLILKVDNA